jgi:hypothetical protein
MTYNCYYRYKGYTDYRLSDTDDPILFYSWVNYVESDKNNNVLHDFRYKIDSLTVGLRVYP